VNHYCTYFDSGYLVRGVALWLSLKRHDPSAVLWALCLDDVATKAVRGLGEIDLRALPLAELEAADPELLAVKSSRSRAEYCFTISPCLPRWVLRQQPGIEVITYVDADMAFFSDPAPLFAELAGHHVLIVEHRFPDFLKHYESYGRFNVGVLCFRNSAEGRRCLDWWREQCLAWCHDRIEDGKFADQKYLDQWPRLFSGVVVGQHPGVDLAPWNWMNYRYRFAADQLLVDGQALIVYHFALFKPRGRFFFDSGQLEFGVMPLRLRSWLYGRYFALLEEARRQMKPLALEMPHDVSRGRAATWRTLLLELIFGPVWLRLGSLWISGRCGVGRFSGRVLVWAHKKIKRTEAS
jgi:hypothetical protein